MDYINLPSTGMEHISHRLMKRWCDRGQLPRQRFNDMHNTSENLLFVFKQTFATILKLEGQ